MAELTQTNSRILIESSFFWVPMKKIVYKIYRKKSFHIVRQKNSEFEETTITLVSFLIHD